MGCVCEKTNLEEDKNEFVDIIKYAPQDIDFSLETKNQNNYSSFFQSHRKIETTNLIESINSTEEINLKTKTNKKEIKKEEEEEEEKLSKINSLEIKEIDEIEKTDYPEKILSIINLIRTNPKIYAKKIEYAVKYIILEKKTVTDKKTGEKTVILKPYFKKKVKVELNKGENAFYEASKRLKEMKSIPPLKMDDSLKINLPNNIKELYDNNYLIKQAEKVKKRSSLEIFYKDLIKYPIISALLMIVDDNSKNDFNKRNTLLNPDLKYVGINCKFIGKTFVAYFGFSK